VVMVREGEVVSAAWLCEVVLWEYEATAAACEVAAFCSAGCCARKAARKPPKKGLLVVMARRLRGSACALRCGCQRPSPSFCRWRTGGWAARAYL
jgi:hypothetical protein